MKFVIIACILFSVLFEPTESWHPNYVLPNFDRDQCTGFGVCKLAALYKNENTCRKVTPYVPAGGITQISQIKAPVGVIKQTGLLSIVGKGMV